MKSGRMANLKEHFKNLPIERKICAAILLTCGITLLCSAAAILVAQMVTFRQAFTRDLETTATIIANNSTAALSFRDRNAANEILGAVRAKAHILEASIDLPEQSSFASYRRHDSTVKTDFPNADGFHFVSSHLILNQPIALANERLGTLRLVSNYELEYRRVVRVYVFILGIVLFGSVVLALVLARRLERAIAQPIVDLAQVAQDVAERKDYRLRAQRTSHDEVGRLTDAFNEMLEKIESHAAALRQANSHLEAEIEGRKKIQEALEESRQRYEVAVLGSSDGLWDWDLIQHKYYYSPRWKGMIGFADDELANTYETWEARLHPEDRERVLQRVDECLSGRSHSAELEFRFQHKDGSFRWVLSRGAVLRDSSDRPVRFAGSHTDITARKQAEEEVDHLHRELVTTSRKAGMAEVATGVLHNVGNVLNSVNVSSTIIRDSLTKSEIPTLARVSNLLQQHSTEWGPFLHTHSKGKLIPGFLQKLALQLEKERTTLQEEHEHVAKNIEHIKEIVAVQQSYASVSGILESVAVAELADDALRINAAGFVRHGVRVVRQYSAVPRVLVDKHKVLQILVNLVHNAKYALDDSGQSDKRLTVSIGLNGGDHVRVQVADNGVGIQPENLTRIFSHGFTTRKNGHGFGLHSGANAAKEMGGSLKAESPGPGMGATFILELPLPPAS